MFLEQELLEHLGEEIRDVIGAGHESDTHDAPMSGLPNAHGPKSPLDATRQVVS